MGIKTKGGIDIEVGTDGSACVDIVITHYQEDNGSFYINVSLPPAEARLLAESILRHVPNAEQAILGEQDCAAINRSTGREREEIFDNMGKPKDGKP